MCGEVWGCGCVGGVGAWWCRVCGGVGVVGGSGGVGLCGGGCEEGGAVLVGVCVYLYMHYVYNN